MSDVPAAQLADTRPEQDQRLDDRPPRDVVAVARLGCVNPQLPPAHAADQRVGDAQLPGQRDRRRARGADVAHLLPGEATVLVLDERGGAQHGGDLVRLQERAIGPLGLRRGAAQVGHGVDLSALGGIAQDTLRGVEHLADRRVREPAPATAVTTAGARVDVVLHQRRAELAGTLDRQALRAQRGDEVLGVSEPQFVGRHVAEAPDRHAQAPAEVAAGLGGALRVTRPDELPMQPLGREHLERARGSAAGRLDRPSRRRRPLAAIDLLHQEATLCLRPVVVPALPGAAETHVVGLAAVGELDAVHDAVCGRRAAQRPHARPGHQPWPRAQIEACIGPFLRCRVRGCWRTRRAMVSEGSEHCTVLAHRLALPWMSGTPAGTRSPARAPRGGRGGLSGGGWCSRPAAARAARARVASNRSRAFGPSPRRTAPSLRALA